MVIVLSVGRFRIPLHLEILHSIKPVDALIVALKRLWRKDEETGEKLIGLWFPQPERIKLPGVDKPVYAYRLGEGTGKERVVVSNKRFSKKKLESYMVRKLRAIRLWIIAVWHDV